MKSILRRPRTLTVALLLAALVTAALRSLSFFIDFDPALGYHNGGTLSTFIYIVTAVALAVCVVYPLLLRKSGSAPTELTETPSTAVRICAPAVVLACVPVIAQELVLGADTASTLSQLGALAALVSVPYFVLPRRMSAGAWFGIGMLAYCTLTTAAQYFDHTVAINSPIKLWLQFSLLALALYLLSELYARAGKPQPLRTLLWGNVAMFLSISGGISTVVAATVEGIVPKSYLAAAILSLMLGIYTAAQLLTAIPAREDETTQTEEA